MNLHIEAETHSKRKIHIEMKVTSYFMKVIKDIQRLHIGFADVEEVVSVLAKFRALLSQGV
jgi:hypothetical protein